MRPTRTTRNWKIAKTNSFAERGPVAGDVAARREPLGAPTRIPLIGHARCHHPPETRVGPLRSVPDHWVAVTPSLLVGPTGCGGKAGTRRWLARLRNLELNEPDRGSPAGNYDRLLSSKHLTNLIRLTVELNEDELEIAKILARGAWWDSIRELHVEQLHSDVAELLQLLNSSKLRTLALDGCEYSTTSLAGILTSPFANRTGTRLELIHGIDGSVLDPALRHRGARPILRSLGFVGRPRRGSLDLPRLLAAPGAGGLEQLDLSDTAGPVRDVPALVESGFWARARSVSLTDRRSCPRRSTATVREPGTRAAETSSRGNGTRGHGCPVVV